MTVTVYSDVFLPSSVIAAGVRGRQRRSNSRAQNQGGFVNINVIWDETLREYEVGFIPMPVDAWQSIEGLYEITEAGAYGFLMLDPKDQKVLAGDGLLQPYTTSDVGANGFGFGVPVYRLAKRYMTEGSSRVKHRRISRPKTAGITRAAAPVTVGVSAGNVSIDYNTGTVTFVADASQSITSIDEGASTTLNFSDGAGIVSALAVVQRVYVSGVSGTGASVLNGLSHVIASKGATSLTISTSTTGLTLAAGTGFKYPQSTEALAWSGDFYVPVHFANDDMDWEMLKPGQFDSRILAGPSSVLMEVRE